MLLIFPTYIYIYKGLQHSRDCFCYNIINSLPGTQFAIEYLPVCVNKSVKKKPLCAVVTQLIHEEKSLKIMSLQSCVYSLKKNFEE